MARTVDHLTPAQRRKAEAAAKTVERVLNDRAAFKIATCNAPFDLKGERDVDEGLKFFLTLRLETPEDHELTADCRQEAAASIGYQLRSLLLRLLRGAEDLCDLART